MPFYFKLRQSGHCGGVNKKAAGCKFVGQTCDGMPAPKPGFALAG